MKGYNEVVNEFVKDCKELILNLKGFKRQIKMIVPLKEQELNFYKHFVDFLGKYEDINTKNTQPIGETAITEMNVTLLSGDYKKIDLKDKMQKMVNYLLKIC